MYTEQQEGAEEVAPAFLRLPLEILVMIAKHVLTTASFSKYQMTAFKRTDFQPLSGLSLAHSSLRRACHCVGMFSYLRPIRELTTADTGRRDIIEKLLERHILTALGVDLSYPEIWDGCAAIIRNIPGLKELRFIGSSTEILDQTGYSELGRKCAAFKGSCLVLRDAHFTESGAQLLLNMRICNIRSLFLERSWLHLDDKEIQKLELPLFPGLQKVRFDGVTYRGQASDILAQLQLGRMVLEGVRLTHFEMSFGIKPCLLLKRSRYAPSIISSSPQFPDDLKRTHDLNPEWRLEANRLYLQLRLEIFAMLRIHSRDSLTFFSDLDEMSGPFVGSDRLFTFWPWIRPLPFTNMKLLIFRCASLESLVQFDSLHNCTVGQSLKTSLSKRKKDHSAWLHVSTVYTYFWTCDCILIETEPCGRAISRSSWAFISWRLLYVAGDWRTAAGGSLRYIVAGNRMDGYSGMQRIPNGSFWEDSMGNIFRGFQDLSPDRCQQLVFDRRCESEISIY